MNVLFCERNEIARNVFLIFAISFFLIASHLSSGRKDLSPAASSVAISTQTIQTCFHN